MTSLANALEPSIRAAAADGPNTLRPRFLSSSASPATSGTSGPTTVRSTSCSVNQVDQRIHVVRGHRRETLGDSRRSRRSRGPRARASRSDPARDASTARARAPLPDHEDLHAPTTRLCSRAGPTPTIEIGTPPTSSRNRTYCCASFGRSSNCPHLADLVAPPGELFPHGLRLVEQRLVRRHVVPGLAPGPIADADLQRLEARSARRAS